VLVGSSLGAGIAELAAAKRPDLVKGLVLIDGCFPIVSKPGKASILMALPFLGRQWYRSFRRNHEAAWKSLYPYYGNLDALGDADRAFLRERVIARVESPNQERGYFATLRSMSAFFLFSKRALPRKIKAFPGKIAILWGDQDRIVPLKEADAFRRLRPDASLVIIADAGHLPHQEKPGETAAEILRFLG
jgi:pimeloyl-ACP methyl ester carboxylesterase